MTNTEIKREIARRFGFNMRKIVLLEAFVDDYLFDYVMFEVCGIQYQINLGELRIYEG